MGFARIPIFAVETPGTLASPTTKVDRIGLTLNAAATATAAV
ncbi:hypothetical protein RMSM_00149 [Rhodopirellula maiorica SM1]|uniref:Uncharacterized protein n=1 Tax=Rhodopirellula maiorica SM1 TaxID=1265738 RepID=M5S5J6_9BACT|nr:hypothetical protein RMSM_00149 [Rhodopirellula maiorica SM1]